MKPTIQTISVEVQTKDRPTTSMATQTELFFHVIEAREFFMAAEIQKWQDVASYLQRGTIPLEAHYKGVRGVRQKDEKIVTDYME